MLNQKKIKKNKIKKSQLLLFGSLLIFLGIFCLSYKHLLFIRSAVFSDMMVLISDNIENSFDNSNDDTNVETEEQLPVNPEINVPILPSIPEEKPKPPIIPPINYDKYLGVLEIPRVSLKRGFFGLDSPDNNISKNVTLVKGSKMPDILNGNLILMAHSGDSYISYFAFLHRLPMGSNIYVTYKKKKYTYKLVKKYDVPKDGSVVIDRNYNKTTLTLITCTNNDDTKQTVYIAEMI